MDSRYSFALRQPCYTQIEMPPQSASRFTRGGLGGGGGSGGSSGSQKYRQAALFDSTYSDSDFRCFPCASVSKRCCILRLTRGLCLTAPRCVGAKRKLLIVAFLTALCGVYLLLASPLHNSSDRSSSLTAAEHDDRGDSRWRRRPEDAVFKQHQQPEQHWQSWFQRRLSRDQRDDRRAESVREMMRFAWRGYLRHCASTPILGNELAPATNACSHASNDLVGPGRLLTVVDSLDTLLVMGLGREFYQARNLLRRHYHPRLDNTSQVSVFETTIRMLGGLLGAFSLTEDPLFARKAAELGDSMASAFSRLGGGGGGRDADEPARVALPRIRLGDAGGSGASASGQLDLTVNLAEPGSLYLEFAYLSEVTGDPKYAGWARRNQAHLMQVPNIDGVYPIHIAFSGRNQPAESTDNMYSAGGEGDSFYEYLVKRCLFDAQPSNSAAAAAACRRAFSRSLDGLTKHLGVLVDPNGESNGDNSGKAGRSLACLIKTSLPMPVSSDTEQQQQQRRQIKGPQLVKQCSMEHLTCFAGGMYALAYLQNRSRTEWLRFAENITRACYLAYDQSPLGLGPETFVVSDELGRIKISNTHDAHVLRPETVESIYYLYQVTGDPVYREWGWKIVLALNRSARTGSGFSGLSSMSGGVPLAYDNTQWSFFLAETLKYLYLLFAPPETLPLDQWLFNTEAHVIPTVVNPLRRRLQAMRRPPADLRRRRRLKLDDDTD